MKTVLRFAVLTAIATMFACGLSTQPSSQSDDAKFVAIAGWLNTPEANKDGRRAVIILSEHKIKCSEAGSAGVTLNVFEQQAAEARKLLATAIRTEGLCIILYDEKGKVAKPGKIFENKKQQ